MPQACQQGIFYFQQRLCVSLSKRIYILAKQDSQWVQKGHNAYICNWNLSSTCCSRSICILGLGTKGQFTSTWLKKDECELIRMCMQGSGQLFLWSQILEEMQPQLSACTAEFTLTFCGLAPTHVVMRKNCPPQNCFSSLVMPPCLLLACLLACL